MRSELLIVLFVQVIWALGVPESSGATDKLVAENADSGQADGTVPGIELGPIEVTGDSEEIQQIDPSLGSRTYQLGPTLIANQGHGLNGGIDEILLHAPGVSRETSGQFHVRGEDYGLQYRINGIQLPPGITSTLGQPFDTRLVQKLTLVDGALPAEYGLLNAGVVEIETKTGSDLDGQDVSLYGGSQATLHPSFSSGWTNGHIDYFVNGNYLQDELGTDNVTAARAAIHDRTRQYQGFALVSDEFAVGQKISLILSGVDASFQIPNAPGLTPEFPFEGRSNFDSSQLNRNQRERNYYGIIAYEVATPTLGFQLAEVNSYSSTHYIPDFPGDLVFTGVASNARRSLLGNGIQFDGFYYPNDYQTCKVGFTLTSQLEQTESRNNVFRINPETGDILADTPETIALSDRQRGYVGGFYLQNDWQLVHGLTVNFGARWDFVNGYVWEQQLSPRINFTYQLAANVAAHFGYARIFTPPLLEYIKPSTLAEFAQTTNAAPELTETAPHSERSHSFDFGVSWNVTRELTVGVDSYYKLVHNMQDETQLGSSLIYTPFTYARGYKVGGEFTVDYRQGSFTLYGNVAIAQAKGQEINSSQGLFTLDELAYIKKHYIHTDYDQLMTLSAGAAYNWKRVTLHGDLLGASGMYGGFANSQKIESHWTLNVGASYTISFGQKPVLTTRFDIVNLFDQSYLLHESGIGATVNQYSERRGFFGGISWMF